MPNIYVRPTALPNVKGRVNYISSDKRQENLVAVFSDVDNQFWHELSEHCQKAAAEAGHKNTCEAREWHGALPNEYAVMYENREEELAEELSKLIEGITGTKNIVALHWNKTKTNFHFHCICSENKEINEITYGAELTRNTYYNQNGKRSPKKECIDSEGNLLPGCKFYPKGSRIEYVKRFGTKENLRDHKINEQIKEALSNKFNRDLETRSFKVFKNDGIHISQQRVGNKVQGEVKASIEAKNELIREYNKTVDKLIAIEPKQALQIKEMRNSIKKYAMSSNWEKAVDLFIRRIKEVMVYYIQNSSKTAERASEKLPERKLSLQEKIAAAKAEAQERKANREVPKPTHKKDLEL